MLVISREMDTGKTKEILKLAENEQATILTSTPRALNVKASALGYNLNIIGWQDFLYKSLISQKIIIDNAEEVLAEIIGSVNENYRLIAMAVNTDAHS